MAWFCILISTNLGTYFGLQLQHSLYLISTMIDLLLKQKPLHTFMFIYPIFNVATNTINDWRCQPEHTHPVKENIITKKFKSPSLHVAKLPNIITLFNIQILFSSIQTSHMYRNISSTSWDVFKYINFLSILQIREVEIQSYNDRDNGYNSNKVYVRVLLL